MSYNYKEIEKKWQNKWEKEGTFYAENNSSKKKWYGLIEFPYPSGQGLHVGHPRSYTAMDIVARKRRMQGYNVWFPIGLTLSDCLPKTLQLRTTFIQRLLQNKI